VHPVSRGRRDPCTLRAGCARQFANSGAERRKCEASLRLHRVVFRSGVGWRYLSRLRRREDTAGKRGPSPAAPDLRTFKRPASCGSAGEPGGRPRPCVEQADDRGPRSARRRRGPRGICRVGRCRSGGSHGTGGRRNRGRNGHRPGGNRAGLGPARDLRRVGEPAVHPGRRPLRGCHGRRGPGSGRRPGHRTRAVARVHPGRRGARHRCGVRVPAADRGDQRGGAPGSPRRHRTPVHSATG